MIYWLSRYLQFVPWLIAWNEKLSNKPVNIEGYMWKRLIDWIVKLNKYIKYFRLYTYYSVLNY